MLICTTCSITIHKSHIDTFVELSRIKVQHTAFLQDFVNETDNVNIPKLNQLIISEQNELSQCKPKYGKLREKIKEENEECKLQLDRIAEEHLALCDRMEIASTQLIQTRITDMEERMETLKKLSSESKQTLQAGSAVLVYDSVSEIQEMELDIPQARDKGIAEFTPGNDRRSLLKQATGSMTVPDELFLITTATHSISNKGFVVKTKRPTYTDQISTETVGYRLHDKPEVISKFVYPDTMTTICPTTDGCAWLCDRFNGNVVLVNNKGKVMQKIERTDKRIDDISLHPTTGRLWSCGVGSETIYEISASNNLVPMFNTSGGLPTSICLTKEGRVVVGVGCEKGYKIEMYTVDGRVLHTVLDGVSGPGLVVSIAHCPVTGNVAIVGNNDYKDNKLYITVHDPTLQQLFTYHGERMQSPDESTVAFDPVTVVYDSKGNIVVNDRSRKTIELVSGEGKHIKTLVTNKGAVGEIGIQKDDVLWSHLKIGKWGVKLFKYYCD